jgi:hypothetical protein
MFPALKRVNSFNLLSRRAGASLMKKPSAPVTKYVERRTSYVSLKNVSYNLTFVNNYRSAIFTSVKSPRSQVAAILHLANDVVVSLLLAHDRDEAIVNENALSDLHDLADVLVVDPDDLFGALLFVGVVCGELDDVALLEGDLLSAVVLHAAADLYM